MDSDGSKLRKEVALKENKLCPSFIPEGIKKIIIILIIRKNHQRGKTF